MFDSLGLPDIDKVFIDNTSIEYLLIDGMLNTFPEKKVITWYLTGLYSDSTFPFTKKAPFNFIF